MLADCCIPRLSKDMKIAVPKNHLEAQIQKCTEVWTFRKTASGGLLSKNFSEKFSGLGQVKKLRNQQKCALLDYPCFLQKKRWRRNGIR